MKGQTASVDIAGLTEGVKQKLAQRCTLDLRDATLLEALFAIRDACGLNVVVGNEVTGTVNASYADTPVCDILDSLLITRGYGYRVVGTSLAIVPLESLGDQLPGFQTQVISLSNCSPNDVIPSVESMLSPEGRAHAVESSHSIVIVDYQSRIEKINAHISELENAAAKYQLTQSLTNAKSEIAPGQSTFAPNIVRVFQLQFVDPSILIQAITPLLSETGQAAAVDKEDKLVVSDTAEKIRSVELALKQLDLPRPQVRIWAMIYDCGVDDLERLGVNWGSSIKSASINATTGKAAQSAIFNTTTNAVESGANGMLTLTSLNTNFDLNSVIQALKGSDDSRLLADPNVVVMDHESAQIAIVTEVPYQQLTQGIDGGTIGTTEFREAGVTLQVTPHIAQDQTIALDVNPRFSLLTGFTEGDNAPIIDRRETTTKVRVANQQTIVLGGLRQRTRIAEHNAIPLVGKLPVVGRLFRHRSLSARESELLVFITPQIVFDSCIGTPREQCINSYLQREINETPTSPVPFGIEILRAEEEARDREIDNALFHLKSSQSATSTQLHSSQLHGLNPNCESCSQQKVFDEPFSPVDMGLSVEPPTIR
ncbi:MAG: hypothetical protein KDB00_26190 [Planctomycetales bacterium]|nr:hypothetical protein [Planctomycetales bacterium]